MKSSLAFEQEVRRVARELFPQSGGYGPVIVDGRERDGIFNDGETIHIVEATCDTTKLKATKDLEKSTTLKKSLNKQYSEHNFRIWFITQKDPTPHQIAEAEAARKKAKCPVSAMSLNAFCQRLIDGPAYLAARENYPFGSVRNPNDLDLNRNVSEKQFIPLTMVEAETHNEISPDDLATTFLKVPSLRLLIGDFGAGKSMTMRHIFYVLRKEHQSGDTASFPVFLNLRDHVGQDEPSSALFDHGTRVGFSQPERLVRAWRAGFVHLFLDGFDEIASSRFRSDAGGLRAVRHRAMTLVRRFIEEHPVHLTTLFISGRGNYFGTEAEMRQALGLKTRAVVILTLNEFTLDQVQQYLRRLGLASEAVPDWLPSRPLLVGYLAAKGIFRDGIKQLTDMSRAQGWDYLLDQICEREGRQIEDLGGQTDRVRMFVDRLATRARATTTGRGPIAVGELVSLFRQVFPSSPDDAAQQLLLRLAGLTVASSSAPMVATAPDLEDAREFVDGDLVDAARAGDVVRFIKYSYDEDLNGLFADRNCVYAMHDLGVEVSVNLLQSLTGGQASAALKVAAEALDASALALDIVRIMQNGGVSAVDPNGSDRRIPIKNGYFSDFEFISGVDLSKVELRDCIIDNVYVDQSSTRILGPLVNNCLIQQVYGAVSREDLPRGIFDKHTEIENFREDVDTAADIRQQPLPTAVRVLLITLRKLFIQPGRGRKQNAFVRGLDDSERPYVGEVLTLVSRFGFAQPHRLGGPEVWIPNRSKMKEVMSMLRAPQQSSNDLIVAVRKL